MVVHIDQPRENDLSGGIDHLVRFKSFALSTADIGDSLSDHVNITFFELATVRVKSVEAESLCDQETHGGVLPFRLRVLPR